MSTYGVVSTINAPRLISVRQPELIKFEVEYASYKEKVADINSSRHEDDQITPASVKNCIKSEVLHSLCIAVSSVNYAVCEKDPGGAAMEFVVQIVTALDKNSVSSVVKDLEKCKSLIGQLCDKLEPQELRFRMNEERTFWASEEKGDLSHFMKRTSALATEIHNGEVARAKMKRGSSFLSKNSSDKAIEQDASTEHVERPKKHLKLTSNRTGTDKPWTKKCLNPKCNLFHRVRDCQITSDEDKKKLLDNYYEGKNSNHIS